MGICVSGGSPIPVTGSPARGDRAPLVQIRHHPGPRALRIWNTGGDKTVRFWDVGSRSAITLPAIDGARAGAIGEGAVHAGIGSAIAAWRRPRPPQTMTQHNFTWSGMTEAA